MLLLLLSLFDCSFLWTEFLKKLCYLFEIRNQPYPKIDYHFRRSFLYNILAFI
jgi:hypothetical protein